MTVVLTYPRMGMYLNTEGGGKKRKTRILMVSLAYAQYKKLEMLTKSNLFTSTFLATEVLITAAKPGSANKFGFAQHGTAGTMRCKIHGHDALSRLPFFNSQTVHFRFTNKELRLYLPGNKPPEQGKLPLPEAPVAQQTKHVSASQGARTMRIAHYMDGVEKADNINIVVTNDERKAIEQVVGTNMAADITPDGKQVVLYKAVNAGVHFGKYNGDYVSCRPPFLRAKALPHFGLTETTYTVVGERIFIDMPPADKLLRPRLKRPTREHHQTDQPAPSPPAKAAMAVASQPAILTDLKVAIDLVNETVAAVRQTGHQIDLALDDSGRLTARVTLTHTL